VLFEGGWELRWESLVHHPLRVSGPQQQFHWSWPGLLMLLFCKWRPRPLFQLIKRRLCRLMIVLWHLDRSVICRCRCLIVYS
jgi:hypothetical protein